MLVALLSINSSFVSSPHDLSLTNPVVIPARCMLLPMPRRHLAHRLFGVCSQSPTSICFLTPELLACGWFVGCELGRHIRSSALSNEIVLEENIGSGRSDEVGWCARLLRQCGVGGGCGCRCLKKSAPVAICASRIGRLSSGVWV
jgi:hypothetical protein